MPEHFFSDYWPLLAALMAAVSWIVKTILGASKLTEALQKLAKDWFGIEDLSKWQKEKRADGSIRRWLRIVLACLLFSIGGGLVGFFLSWSLRPQVNADQIPAKEQPRAQTAPAELDPNAGVYSDGPVLRRKLSHREVDDLLDTLKQLRQAALPFNALNAPQDILPPLPPVYPYQPLSWNEKIKRDGFDATIKTVTDVNNQFEAAFGAIGHIISADSDNSDEIVRIVGKTGVPEIVGCLRQYVFALQTLKSNNAVDPELIRIALEAKARDCTDAFEIFRKWRNTFIPKRLPEVRKEIESDGAHL